MKTGSTQKEMNLEICSQCHPFYTGKKKVMDIAGRVDRFKKMTEKKETIKSTIAKAKAEKSVAAKVKMDKKAKAEKKPVKARAIEPAKKTKK